MKHTKIFSHVLRVFIRNIKLNLVSIVISSLGLLVVISSVYYLIYENSFDKFHRSPSDIFRIVMDFKLNDQSIYSPISSEGLVEELAVSVTGVESFNRIVADITEKTIVFTRNPKESFREKALFTDPNFFEFFNFPLENGNSQTVLRDPTAAVITRAVANKVFGDKNPLGEEIQIAEKKYIIRAICESLPINTHMTFAIVVSRESHRLHGLDAKLSANHFAYIRIPQKSDVEKVSSALKSKWNSILKESIQTNMGMTMDQFSGSGGRFEFDLFPLLKTHYYGDFDYDFKEKGSLRNTIFLSLTGLICLILILLNYTVFNISKYKSSSTFFGVSKVYGARGLDLWSFFFFDSLLSTLLSFLLLGSFFWVLFETENLFFVEDFKSYKVQSQISIFIIICLLAFAIITSSISSFLYNESSSLRLIRQKEVQSKSKFRGSTALLLIQLVVVSGISTFTLGVSQHFKFISKNDLGMNVDAVSIVENITSLGPNMGAFKDGLLGIAGVNSASFSSWHPFSDVSKNVYVNSKNGENILLSYAYTDHNISESLGFRFSRKTDLIDQKMTQKVIINETALNQLGWLDIDSHTIQLPNANGYIDYDVIGVVQDFVTESPSYRVDPMVFFLRDAGGGNRLLVNTDQLNENVILREIKDLWFQFSDNPPVISSLGNKLKLKTIMNDKFETYFLFLTTVISLISAIGIFGFYSHFIDSRTKGFALRKVFGASTHSLYLDLLKKSLKYVIIAIVFSYPLTYLILSKWLEGFAVRESIDINIFILNTLMIILLVLLLTSAFLIRINRIDFQLLKRE